MTTVCIFCGSRSGESAQFAAEARQVTRMLVEAGHAIVYGGGSVGIMGVVAETALQLGGRLTGVIPHGLATRELMHDRVEDMRVVSGMHSRKQLMHELADVYIVLPGGYGTMEELFEAVTWSQLGIHDRPIGVLNCCGYYDGLRDLCDRMVAEAFLDVPTRQLLMFFSDCAELAEWLRSVTPRSMVHG